MFHFLFNLGNNQNIEMGDKKRNDALRYEQASVVSFKQGRMMIYFWLPFKPFLSLLIYFHNTYLKDKNKVVALWDI
jgi:hypothetical protein